MKNGGKKSLTPADRSSTQCTWLVNWLTSPPLLDLTQYADGLADEFLFVVRVPTAVAPCRQTGQSGRSSGNVCVKLVIITVPRNTHTRLPIWLWSRPNYRGGVHVFFIWTPIGAGVPNGDHFNKCLLLNQHMTFVHVSYVRYLKKIQKYASQVVLWKCSIKPNLGFKDW